MRRFVRPKTVIEKLILRDFMAHSLSEFSFGPGLSVLCGPNNTGKSAVIEALRCLASNPAPRHFIRHGAKQAEVEVVLADATRVVWIRRKDYALYHLYAPGAAEPEIFAKFGRKPPLEILDALKLNNVELDGGEEIDVHLGNQREPIFLINKPGSVMASFFAAASESAHLMSMQGLLKDRVRKAKQEDNRLKLKQGELRAELDKLAPLPALKLGLGLARDKLSSLQLSAAALPELESRLKVISKIKEKISFNSARINRLCALRVQPALWPAKSLAELLASLEERGRKHRQLSARNAWLAQLLAPPRIFNAAELFRGLLALRDVAGQSRLARKRDKTLEALREPPRLHDLKALSGMLDERGRIITRALAAKQRLALASGLREPPAKTDLSALQVLLSALASLRGRCEASAQDLLALEARLAKQREKIAAALERAGTCPLCGGELDAARFIL